MSIGSFYSYMCHNSLFTCLFYYILAFVHTGSLLSLPFLIVLATDDPCRSGTLFSCISNVTCMPLHPSFYWLVCMHRQVFTLQSLNISSSYWLVCVHSCWPPFILSCASTNGTWGHAFWMCCSIQVWCSHSIGGGVINWSNGNGEIGNVWQRFRRCWVCWMLLPK